MMTTMDMNGFNSTMNSAMLHLEKIGAGSETDDLLDVWDTDLQQVSKLRCSV